MGRWWLHITQSTISTWNWGSSLSFSKRKYQCQAEWGALLKINNMVLYSCYSPVILQNWEIMGWVCPLLMADRLAITKTWNQTLHGLFQFGYVTSHIRTKWLSIGVRRSEAWAYISWSRCFHSLLQARAGNLVFIWTSSQECTLCLFLFHWIPEWIPRKRDLVYISITETLLTSLTRIQLYLLPTRNVWPERIKRKTSDGETVWCIPGVECEVPGEIEIFLVPKTQLLPPCTAWAAAV